MGLLRKIVYDKTFIIEVERQNETVPFVTKGRRIETPELGTHYEVLAPHNPKVKYQLPDIPTDMVSASGVIRVFTKDFEQFSPSRLKAPKGKTPDGEIHLVKTKLGKEVQLDQFFLDASQKSFYGKAIKDAFLKTQKKTWWNENKNIIMIVLVLGFIALIAYILMDGVMAVTNQLSTSVGMFNAAAQSLVPPPV